MPVRAQEEKRATTKLPLLLARKSLLMFLITGLFAY